MLDRKKTIRELEDMVASIRSQRGMALESLIRDVHARREQDLHVLGKAITLLKEIKPKPLPENQIGVQRFKPTSLDP